MHHPGQSIHRMGREEVRIYKELVEMGNDLDERTSREIELEEQTRGGKGQVHSTAEFGARLGDYGEPRNQKIQNISWQ